jgi:hypothetical protein
MSILIERGITCLQIAPLVASVAPHRDGCRRGFRRVLNQSQTVVLVLKSSRPRFRKREYIRSQSIQFGQTHAVATAPALPHPGESAAVAATKSRHAPPQPVKSIRFM